MKQSFIDQHFRSLAVILFCVMAMFTGILLVQLRIVYLPASPVATTPAVVSEVSTTATPVPASQIKKYPTDLGTRTPGTTEEVPITANPKDTDDVIAMVRWYIENGEVISLQIPGYINLGACADLQKFNSNRLCVDIAKNGPFNSGEILGTVTIKWSESGSGLIYREEGDGYYNG